MHSSLTHIFFDLHGTLIDGVALHPCYSQAMGRLLAARYGGDPSDWAQANSRVLDDWDSYYADLDLGGDEGLAHMWEGLYRTTRAMFRLVGIAEPPPAELSALSRELPGQVTRGCDAFYPDARPVLRALHTAGYILGITSHGIVGHTQGLLAGGGMTALFAGPLVGPDNVGRFNKDAAFFRMAAQQAGVAPGACLVVDDDLYAVAGAKAAGMHTAQMRRRGSVFSSQADLRLDVTLDALPGLLATWRSQGRGQPAS